MDKPDLGKYQPSCLLAHELINKLSVIVGNCDLLQQHSPDDPESLKRIHAIRDMAKVMAAELNEHQCHLDAMTKAAEAWLYSGPA